MPAEIPAVKAEKPVPDRAIDLEDDACFKQRGKVTSKLLGGCGRSCHQSNYIKMLILQLNQKTGKMLCCLVKGKQCIYTGLLALEPGNFRKKKINGSSLL